MARPVIRAQTRPPASAQATVGGGSGSSRMRRAPHAAPARLPFTSYNRAVTRRALASARRQGSPLFGGFGIFRIARKPQDQSPRACEGKSAGLSRMMSEATALIIQQCPSARRVDVQR